MRCSRLIPVTGSLLAAALVAGVVVAQTKLTRQDASRFQEKVALIERAETQQVVERRRTPVTEAEINSYLAYDGRNQVPAGVVEPRVSILGEGRVTGEAVVDLDAVRRQQRSRGLLDPLRYLTGRLPVAATGVVHTRDGVAWLDLESAQVSGLPVPKTLLDELLRYYSRTPENPKGLSLDDRIQLPARIREIEIGRGQAVVVQ